MIIKKFEEPVFNGRVLFLTDCTAEQANKYLEKKNIFANDDDPKDKFDEFSDGGIRSYVEDLGNKEAGVSWVVHIEDKNDIRAYIHECIHIVNGIFEDRQIQFVSGNDELIAYYMDYWFEQLWYHVHPKKRGKIGI